MHPIDCFDERRIELEDYEQYTIGKMLFPKNEEKRIIWIIRSYFRLANERFVDCSCKIDDEQDYEIHQVVGAQLGGMIYKLGGWDKVMSVIHGKQPSNFRDMTLETAGRGFIAGRVLLKAFECDGIIEKACENAMISCVVKKSAWNETISHPEPDSKHIHRKFWHEFSKVAHLWAAASEFFEDQVHFVDTICFQSGVFNRARQLDEPLESYGHFLQRAKEIHEAATNFKTSSGKIIKIIDCDFG